MEISKTQNGKGKGWVMSGAINGDLSKWFEKWFETKEKAIAFATKKGWKWECK